jgi:uncharacterized protein (DUF1697 family)
MQKSQINNASVYDLNTWTQFFKEACVPAQFVHEYAVKFYENRIRFDMLNELDKNLLNEMGITAIGDCLCILKHSKHVYSKVKKASYFIFFSSKKIITY